MEKDLAVTITSDELADIIRRAHPAVVQDAFHTLPTNTLRAACSTRSDVTFIEETDEDKVLRHVQHLTSAGDVDRLIGGELDYAGDEPQITKRKTEDGSFVYESHVFFVFTQEQVDKL